MLEADCVRENSAIGGVIGELVAAGQIRGAGVAVAVHGQPVIERYAGNARDDLAAGPETFWPVASISKLYTAAAIGRLIERGKITLGTRVSSVLPEFTGDGRESITLRQLMTHTSGLPYESPHHEARLAARWSVDQLTDEACGAELRFEPGTGQRYSDFGYAVAGRMAAVAAGTPFPELLRREVLDPAGLRETRFPTPASIHPRIAVVEGAPGSGTTSAMYTSAYGLGLAHPAFGVVATLPDLLRFGLLFRPECTNRIHSLATIRMMTTDQTGGDDPAESVIPRKETVHPWGIGFAIKGAGISPELVSPESYGHGGATGCYLWIDPRYDLVVAFVSNRHYAGDPERFMPRLDSVMNVVWAAMTR
jgi:beta-lactamase class C